jgi:exodeoxyribonuclease VII small subunit
VYQAGPDVRPPHFVAALTTAHRGRVLSKAGSHGSDAYNQRLFAVSPMTKRNAPAQIALPERYEDALAELDRLVLAMEGAQLPLDQLLDHYRRGAELLAFCRTRLDAVEQQVKVLENGQPKPWEGAA